MDFKFEKLTIWQKSIDFGESINTMAYKLPKEEIFNLYEFAFNLMNMMVAFKDKIKMNRINNSPNKLLLPALLTSDFGLLTSDFVLLTPVSRLRTPETLNNSQPNNTHL